MASRSGAIGFAEPRLTTPCAWMAAIRRLLGVRSAGPNHPEVTILSWKTNAASATRWRPSAGFEDSHIGARVEFQKPDLILITDEIEGPPGQHDIEQLWHLDRSEARARLELPQDAELVESWRSKFSAKSIHPHWCEYAGAWHCQSD